MRKIKILLISFFLFLIPSISYSLIEVDISRGNLNPLPISVSPLFADKVSNSLLKNDIKIENLGLKIADVVENNLRQTGLFNPLSRKAFLQKPDIAHLKPRFEDWALIKSQALITGKISYKNEKLKVEFRLWDVLAGREMLALAFTLSLIHI